MRSRRVFCFVLLGFLGFFKRLWKWNKKHGLPSRDKCNLLGISLAPSSFNSWEVCKIQDHLSTLKKTSWELIWGITFQLWIFAITKYFLLKKITPKTQNNNNNQWTSQILFTHTARSTITHAVFKNASRHLGKTGVAHHSGYPAQRAQNLVAKDRLFHQGTDRTSAHEQKYPNLHNFERREVESRASPCCSRSWGWKGGLQWLPAQQVTRTCCKVSHCWAGGSFPEATLGEKWAGKPRCSVLPATK